MGRLRATEETPFCTARARNALEPGSDSILNVAMDCMQTGRDPNQPGRQMDNLGVGVGWEGFLPSPSLSYGPALAPLPLGHPPQLYILQSPIEKEISHNDIDCTKN